MKWFIAVAAALVLGMVGIVVTHERGGSASSAAGSHLARAAGVLPVAVALVGCVPLLVAEASVAAARPRRFRDLRRARPPVARISAPCEESQ